MSKREKYVTVGKYITWEEIESDATDSDWSYCL